MANVDDNLLIPNIWITEIIDDAIDEETGEYDEALAAKRLLFLCLSGIEGEAVKSKDPAVDYWLLGYKNRIKEMKAAARTAKMSLKERDEKTYQMAKAGMKSEEIADILLGDKNKGSTIRKRPAWEQAQKELAKDSS